MAYGLLGDLGDLVLSAVGMDSRYVKETALNLHRNSEVESVLDL